MKGLILDILVPPTLGDEILIFDGNGHDEGNTSPLLSKRKRPRETLLRGSRPSRREINEGRDTE